MAGYILTIKVAFSVRKEKYIILSRASSVRNLSVILFPVSTSLSSACNTQVLKKQCKCWLLVIVVNYEAPIAAANK
jgi:hypothetical protein